MPLGVLVNLAFKLLTGAPSSTKKTQVSNSQQLALDLKGKTGDWFLSLYNLGTKGLSCVSRFGEGESCRQLEHPGMRTHQIPSVSVAAGALF